MLNKHFVKRERLTGNREKSNLKKEYEKINMFFLA
jgi:hypothetical protein